ncbi:hypothetical protein IAU60_004150 [Kwoniella sp. DSM 27419]
MEHLDPFLSLLVLLQSPSRTRPQPRRPTGAPSPAPKSLNHIFTHTPSSSSTASSPATATTYPTPAASSSQHPLAQPPITAKQAGTQASPAALPFLPLAPAQVASLRAGMMRRRSSYPPAVTPGSASAHNLFPWVVGGTPAAGPPGGFDWGAAFDNFPGFGSEVGPEPERSTAPGTVAWETLLSFETDVKSSPNAKQSADLPNAIAAVSQTVPRAKSDPLTDHAAPVPEVYAQEPTPLQAAPSPSTPQRMIQFGTDLAWRTALASVVDVDGVGQITVARVLQEVWRRGGGELVTSQCLWPSIVIALAMPPTALPGARVPNPSAQSSMALQQLYNLSIRHWEPAIFTGLLGVYAASVAEPSAVQADKDQAPVNAFAPIPHYGPSTPLREPDVSQWMNLTPSGWSFLASDMPAGNDSQDQADASIQPITGFPFPLNTDLLDSVHNERRTSLSMSKTDGADDLHAKSIDEILASMEDGIEETERAVIAANLATQTHTAVISAPPTEVVTKEPIATFQFPTPETDSSNSPGRRSSKPTHDMSPVSMASPFVSAGSNAGVLQTPTNPTASLPTPVSERKNSTGKARPNQLSMPPVEFIPPPPMCMFFNSSFENLTDGKAGIWRGDLEVRGRGGGKFPIIVVGEKDTEHLWQSHLWSQTLTYPLNSTPVESCTSTMIPVSHLAREGLIPLTMGMVLCNEPPERLAPYVNMVQGLHAEGVGFHLPCETRLPIVFLPAKFHSTDPLLRLGIAFMGKTGFAHPNGPVPSTRPVSSGKGRSITQGAAEDGPKKKKRRQSAPAMGAVAPLKGRKKDGASVEKIVEEAE